MGNIGDTIQGDNSAGHCFCLKGFNSNERFQIISRDYETENVQHRQNFCSNLSKGY